MAKAPIIPGGKIIGGMGGRVYLGNMGSGPEFFQNYNAMSEIPTADEGGGTDGSIACIEIDQWTIARQWINAECTHSGTYGAITRRNVAFDWHFQLSFPADQANLPDHLLGFLSGDSPSAVNTAIAFYLGDCIINPEAVAMEMVQKYYFAPMCIVNSVHPVLNASRDVIRYQVTGDGNSRLWLMPEEKDSCTLYLGYLKSRGWWV